jgi:hypothetical protein
MNDSPNRDVDVFTEALQLPAEQTRRVFGAGLRRRARFSSTQGKTSSDNNVGLSRERRDQRAVCLIPRIADRPRLPFDRVPFQIRKPRLLRAAISFN